MAFFILFIGMKKVKWSEKQIEFLKSNYPDKGAKFCSNELHIQLKSVKYKISTLNLKVTKERKKNVQSENVKKVYKYPEKEHFINLSSKEVCYIMGFIWADGSLVNNNLVLEILESDFLDIKNIFFKIGEWRVSFRQRENRKKQALIGCHNVNICNIFKNYNYQNKSVESPEFINLMSDELRKYFFRGWVDGDGCFYKNNKLNQFVLAGTYTQNWNIICKLLNDLNIKYNIKKTKNIKSKNSVIRITNYQGIVNLGNYIYGNEFDGLGLRRKYNKFILIKNKK